jgi:hypothetical protein
MRERRGRAQQESMVQIESTKQEQLRDQERVDLQKAIRCLALQSRLGSG